VVLLAAPVAAGLFHSAAPGSARWSTDGGTTGTCTGPTLTGQISGLLSVRSNASSPPSVAGVSLALGYRYQVVVRPLGGGTSSASCAEAQTAALTDASGAFNATLGLPPSSCDISSCTIVTGPFGPFAVLDAAAVPAGYFLTGTLNGSVARASFVDALDSIHLTPSYRATVSAGAPLAVWAVARAGDGSLSPASVAFGWSLAGGNWTLVTTAPNGSAALRADGPGWGRLTVSANGSFNGSAVSAPAVSLSLNAVATALVGGSDSPTSVDVGVPVTVELQGSGAPGYAYTASVDPGLGANATALPCTETPVSSLLVDVSCAGSIVFERGGTTTPVATLTNGYSSATLSLGALSVYASLRIAVLAPSASYAGAPFSLAIQVVEGTGTSPYGPACLAFPNTTVRCQTTGVSPWTFPLTFSSPGEETVVASVLDATGTNATAAVSIAVVTAPDLSALSSVTSVLPGGTNETLQCALSGGALPAEAWWNDSIGSGPSEALAATPVRADGAVSLVYASVLAGTHTVQLTVRDALGATVGARFTVYVEPGPTAQVRAEAVGAAFTAGMARAITLSALTTDDVVTPAFDGGVDLDLAGVGGPAPIAWWANLSSGETFRPNASGWVGIPGGAWSGTNGVLPLELTCRTAGTFAFLLRTTVPVAFGAGLGPTVTVGPDVAHVRLADPQVVHPGLRSNATLYRIADRWGNPVLTGFVTVETFVGGLAQSAPSPIEPRGGLAFVWVNYSIPGTEAGTVAVLSADNVSLLPELSVPALGGPSIVSVYPLVLVAGAGIAAFAVALRRMRPAGPLVAEANDDDLRRMAEGRARLLGRLRAGAPADLDELLADWPPPPPSRAEVVAWVGALVTEGQVRATVGPDGAPRFVAANPPGRPRVELDARALDAALARGSEDGASEEAGPARP
jgi:hypothetical protein